MFKKLQDVMDCLDGLDGALDPATRATIFGALTTTDKALTLAEFKLQRADKVKRTTGILLEETIDELERKRERVERQNYELGIESALERVRAQIVGMSSSGGFVATVHALFREAIDLGVGGVIEHGFGQESAEGQTWHAWDRARDAKYSLALDASDRLAKAYLRSRHPVDGALVESILAPSDAAAYWDTLAGHFDREPGHRAWPAVTPQPVIAAAYLWTCGGYYAQVLTDEVLDERERSILTRFAKLFEQATLRHRELQKREAQEQALRLQATLDRVRGKIASMRSAEDLQAITRIIWDELTHLGVPFTRCGIFIVHEDLRRVDAYLSGARGQHYGALKIPYGKHALIAQMVEAWRADDRLALQWDAAQVEAWLKAIDVGDQMGEAREHPAPSTGDEAFALSFTPFSQGLLYVADHRELGAEDGHVVKALAEAFDIAYARYDDFRKLEEAKARTESTLRELKATQAQLIQSEKMASLGELTAGIAHEIQNPLNFVNNFSEVSRELIEEMLEELEKGDKEEVNAIAAEVIENLDRIQHHGKRADAIVKGMLQHSRKSDGARAETDLNELVDEYLRLAYHGLRAKDKQFNATILTEYATGLPLAWVVAQDIGRVVLNLITNAFHAVKERSMDAARREPPEVYEPTVTVQTAVAPEGVLITVTDNGNGVPEGIVAKVFQPFFTTKPSGQGTGLGLSLSYDIAKAHGGSLTVATEPGTGATFTVRLPLSILSDTNDSP